MPSKIEYLESISTIGCLVDVNTYSIVHYYGDANSSKIIAGVLNR